MSAEAEASVPVAKRDPTWRVNLLLFVATVASVFVTNVVFSVESPDAKDLSTLKLIWLGLTTKSTLASSAQFAGSLLTILVAHELGHYVAARIHKVDTSLPFFIPLPILSPFGTMGAVIRMRGSIPTRRALFDIGAAGPLAGLVFALPIYAWGVAHSKVIPIGGGGAELGESLLIRGMDALFGPHVLDGTTVLYSPAAFGAWGGMFVTMINLLPVGQLDGGHVAYALFGQKQDRYATFVHRAMLVFFGVIVVGHLGRDISAGRAITASSLGRHIGNGIFWLVWFQVLAVLGTLAKPRRPDGDESEDAPRQLPITTRLIAGLGLLGLASMAREFGSWLYIGAFVVGFAFLIAMEVTGGVLRKHELLEHPQTSEEPLDPLRRALAIFTLLLFALLFMPEPFAL